MNDIFYKVGSIENTTSEMKPTSHHTSEKRVEKSNASTVSVDSSLFKSNNIQDTVGSDSCIDFTQTPDLNNRLVDIHRVMLDSEYIPNKVNDNQKGLYGGSKILSEALDQSSENITSSTTNRDIASIFPLALSPQEWMETTEDMNTTEITDSSFDLPGHSSETISDKYSSDLISKASTVSTPDFTSIVSENETTTEKTKKKKHLKEYY